MSLLENQNYTQGIEKLNTISEKSVYYNDALIELQIARTKMQQTQQIPQTQQMEQEEKKQEINPTEIEESLTYYCKGKIDTCLSRLSALKEKVQSGHPLESKVNDFIESIRKVKTLSERGEKEYKNNQVSLALKTWKELLQLEEKIIGRASSYYSTRIYIHLASEYCKNAQEFLNNEDYIKSNEFCNKALKVKPNFKEALRIKNVIAGNLYNEGVRLEPENRALAMNKYNEVLQVALPDSDYYKKAETKLSGNK